MKKPISKRMPHNLQVLVNEGILPRNTQYFRMGKAHILLSSDLINGRIARHLSISRKDRYPSWDEIHMARYDLLPNDSYFAIILPPKEEYVNLEKNTFHLHQISGPSEKKEEYLNKGLKKVEVKTKEKTGVCF